VGLGESDGHGASERDASVIDYALTLDTSSLQHMNLLHSYQGTQNGFVEIVSNNRSSCNVLREVPVAARDDPENRSLA